MNNSGIKIKDLNSTTSIDSNDYLIVEKPLGTRKISGAIFSKVATKDELSNKADISHRHNKNEIDGLDNLEIDLTGYATKDDLLTKADKIHSHSEYLTEHQDISHKADKSDIYTKAQTDNKISEEIAKAQIGGSGEVDLSAYATKTYVDNEISKIELKEGPKGEKGDKGDIGPQGEQGADGLTTSISVNGNIYTHVDGLITLPNYLENTTDLNDYALKSELHEHNNKSVLDIISFDDISSWNNKSNFSGSYNDLTDKPSSLPASGGNANTVGGYSIWVGTQSEYDALTTKDINVIYLVKEG